MTQDLDLVGKRIREIKERNEQIIKSLSDVSSKFKGGLPNFYESNKSKQLSFKDRIDAQRAQLENDDLSQDIRLRKITLMILFIFLGVETLVVFTIAFFQGFLFKGFYIEEWSFRLLITATITQITTMLLIAVKHLFPNRKKISL